MAYAAEDPNIAASPSIQLWRSDNDKFVPLRWKFSNTGNTKKPYYSRTRPTQCEFSEDGKTVTAVYICPALSPAQFFVIAWDTNTGQEQWHFNGLNSFAPTSMFLSPGGQQLAVCEWEKEKLTLFDLSSPHPSSHSKERREHDFPVRAVLPVLGQSVAWSPDGRILAIYTGPHIEFWNLKKKTRALADTSPVGSSGESRLLRWSPNGRFLATADVVTLSIWDTKTQRWSSVFHPSDSGYGAFSLAWMPDSESLWVGGDSPNEGKGHVQLWSIPDLKVMRELPTKGPVDVSRDGQTLATRNLDKSVNGALLWNIG